jgi:hypothetical protein
VADQIDLFYAGPGDGKTAALIHLIAKIYNDTGKISRVYVGDGSGLSYVESGLVDAGIVQLMDFSVRDYPLTVCNQICSGWFLEDPADPTSRLVAPTPMDLAKIGGWVYEGLSVMGSYIMGNTIGGLAWRGAQGEKIGQDSPISITDEGGMKFGGNPISHFSVGQRQILTNVQHTRGLPGRVWWTAHERFSENAKVEGADRFIGPEVVGGAMTPWISREFANTLHFCTASKQGRETDQFSQKQVNKSSREYRVYTRDHNDPDGLVPVRYKAVNRCAVPDMMPDYFVGKQPGDNIMEFYKTMYDARKRFMTTKLVTRALPSAQVAPAVDAPIEVPHVAASPAPKPGFRVVGPKPQGA